MGMGYAAAHAYVISHDNLKKLCPTEYDNLKNTLAGLCLSWSELAEICQGLHSGLSQDEERILVKAVTALKQSFREATVVDGESLSLEICYYNEKSGDRYDEIDHHKGCFFAVNGFVKLTAPGEKFRDIINEQSWVIFG